MSDKKSQKTQKTQKSQKSKSQTSSLEVELDGDSSGDSSLGLIDTDDDDDFDQDAADLINIQDAPSAELPVFEEDKGPLPPTNLVIRLHPYLRAEAVTYLTKKIKSPKTSGGAELLLRVEPFSGFTEIVLHLSATSVRFLEVAEFLELRKIDDSGRLREFHVRDLDAFLYDDILLETLITPAEKELAVLTELQNLRALPGEPNVPGYPKLKLHSGQSIFQVYVEHNLITSYHPLHDEAGLELLLDTNWFSVFMGKEPFDQLRRYFGEAIALNFTFTGCYTYWMAFPAIITLLLAIIPDTMISDRGAICIVSLMNLVFITFFLKFWKRKCSALAYTWGTLRMTAWEQPRQGYRGRMGLDPVTGQYQPRYPGYKTALKVWLVSLPIVMLCMFIAYRIMLCYFMVEEMLIPIKKRHKGHPVLGLVLKFSGSTLYALSVAVMTHYYRKLAKALTEWENHRTQTQFDRNHVAKLIAFESVNNFMSFFYIAFVMQDLDLLRTQVIVMISVMHLILALQEIVIPVIWRSTTKKLKAFLNRHDRKFPDVVHDAVVKVKDTVTRVKRTVTTNNASTNTPPPPPPKQQGPAAGPTVKANPNRDPVSMGLDVLPAMDPRIEMSKFEAEMDRYQGSYDDYSQLFVQFGYIFLFSPLFPQSVAVAVATNVFLMYANVYKLCAVFQQPIPKRVKDIGSWQMAFELIGYFAVMANIALLVLSTELKKSAIKNGWSSEQFFFALILAEHLLIAGRLAVSKFVPNVPQWVRIASARTEYRARMAFKKEQSTKSRRRLSNKFQAINAIRRQ